MEGGSVPATPAQAQPVATQQGEPAQGAEESRQGSQNQVTDDPDIELDDGVKLKRSELRDLHKRRKDLDRGAFEKMQQAAQMRKEASEESAQAKQLVQSLSKDAKSALRAAGIDPYKFAEETLQEALNEFQLSPAEKEAREYKQRLAEYEAKEAERKQAQEQEQTAAQVAQWEQRFDQAFSGAIQTVGLPKTARVVARMAEKVDAYWSAGVEVPLEEIAAEIKDELRQERRETHGQSLQAAMAQGDEAVMLWVEENIDPDEQKAVQRALLRKAQGAQPKQQVQPSAKREKKPQRGFTRAELDERITKRLGA